MTDKKKSTLFTQIFFVFRSTWPPILQAAAVWLSYGQGFESLEVNENDENSRKTDEINADMFHLLLGVCIEGLANTRSADLTKEQVSSCLKTLLVRMSLMDEIAFKYLILILFQALLDHEWVRKYLSSINDINSSRSILVELCNVLHRTVLTRETVATQTLALEVLKLVLITAKDILEVTKKGKSREMGLPANQNLENNQELSLLGKYSKKQALKSKMFLIIFHFNDFL